MLKKGARRWYDPETGRFTSLDPARDGINWYVYCLCNPVSYSDSTGLTPYNIPRQYLPSQSPWNVDYYSYQLALSYVRSHTGENALLRMNAHNYINENWKVFMDAWQDTANKIHYIFEGTGTNKKYYAANYSISGGTFKQEGYTTLTEATYNEKVAEIMDKYGNNPNLAAYGYGQTYCTVGTSAICKLYGAPAIWMLNGVQQGPASIYKNLREGKYNNDVGFFQEVSYEMAKEYGNLYGLAIASSTHHVTSFMGLMGSDEINSKIASVYHIGGWHEIGKKSIWESFGEDSWENFLSNNEIKFYIWIKYDAFETAWNSFKAENGYAAACLMERANWGGRTTEEQIAYEQKYGTPGGA